MFRAAQPAAAAQSPAAQSPAIKIPRRPSPRRPAGAATCTQVLVLGPGPGGYTAAFRAADLGKVTLVERDPPWVACAQRWLHPSKALLHAAKVIDEAAEMGAHGVRFGARRSIWTSCAAGKPEWSAGSPVGWRAGQAAQGRVVPARADSRADHVAVSDAARDKLRFEQAHHRRRIEAGTATLPAQGDPRIIDSTGALELARYPGGCW